MADRINEYRLLREVGKGATSLVYLAEVADEATGLPLGTRVALKVFHPHVLANATAFDRFLREVQVGRTIEHPNVVRLLGVGATRGEETIRHYLVMEYVAGKTLREVLLDGSRCSEGFCRHVAQEAAEGLAAIHAASIVHRDVKPENLAIAADLGRVRIMDLGVARIHDEMLRLSMDGGFIGTLQYAAPEQLSRRCSELDGRADLYSLGLVLFELATGRHAFADSGGLAQPYRQLAERISPPSTLNPGLSQFFEQVILTLLEPEAGDRFHSARELAQVLELGESSPWWRAHRRHMSQTGERPIRRLTLARDTQLYGREMEVEALREAWQEVRAGRGRVLIVRGEAGIGKSRLTDEFISRLDASGEKMHYLLGTYPPGGAATAAGAFVTAFREHLELEGLEESVKRYLDDRPMLQRAFLALLRGEPPPPEMEDRASTGLEPAFLVIVRKLAQKRPVIVHVEDLHLAPRAGLGLFGSMSHAVATEPVLLLATARPELPTDWTSELTRLDHGEVLDVRRLAVDDIRGILAELTRSPLVASVLTPKVASFSDGNPYFVFELLRTLRQQGYLNPRADGSLQLEQDMVDMPVPERVADLIQARVSGLDESARELLDVASCLGFFFDPSLVAEVVGRPPLQVLQELGRLETTHRIVRWSGRQYSFDHHQVQEVMYGLLSPLLREAYHDAIGTALESRIAETDDLVIRRGLMVDACRQLVRANRGARALVYLSEALEHLAGGQLKDVALDLLDEVLAVPGLVVGSRRIRLLLQRVDELSVAGRTDETWAAIEEARAAVETEPDAALAMQVEAALGRHHQRAGRLREARTHALRTLRMARAIGDRAREISARRHLGTILEDLGRYRGSELHYRKSLALARDGEDHLEEAKTLSNLGGMEFRVGRYRRGIQLLRESLGIFEKHGYDIYAGRTAGNIGVALVAMGELEEAQDLLERALITARESGNFASEAKVVGNLGILYRARGELADARRCLEQDLRQHRELGDPRNEGLAHLYLAEVEHLLGRLDRSRVHVEAVLELQRKTGYAIGHGAALVHLARLELEWGDLDRAQAHLHEAVAEQRALTTDPDVWATQAMLAEVHHLRGDPEGAIRLLDDILDHATDPDSRSVRARAMLLRSRMTGEGLEEAVSFAEEVGPPRPVQERMQRTYDLWCATEDRRYLSEAHAMLQIFRQNAPEDARLTIATGINLHREVMQAWEGARVN